MSDEPKKSAVDIKAIQKQAEEEPQDGLRDALAEETEKLEKKQANEDPKDD